MRSQSLFFSLLLLIHSSGNAYANSNNKIQELLAKFPPIEKVNEFIKNDPNNGELYAGRAAIYELKRDFPAAISDWNKVAELKYDSQGHPTDLYSHRGLCYFGMKNYDAALADFEKAVALAPNDAFCLANRGAAFIEKKQYDPAMKDISRAIEIDPKQALFYSSMGELCYKTKQYPRAMDYLNKAIKMDSTMGDAFYYRGSTLSALGKKSEAQLDLQRANKFGFKLGEPSTYLPVEP